MKNLSVLSITLLTLCVLFFSACKKEDELSTKDKLIGEWKYEFRKYEHYEDGQLTDSGIDTVMGTTIEFQGNDTYLTTIEVSNQPTITGGGIWTLEDTKIILGDVGNRQLLQIKEITETSMILIQEDEITESNGILYKYKDEVSFIKQ